MIAYHGTRVLQSVPLNRGRYNIVIKFLHVKMSFSYLVDRKIVSIYTLIIQIYV